MAFSLAISEMEFAYDFRYEFNVDAIHFVIQLKNQKPVPQSIFHYVLLHNSFHTISPFCLILIILQLANARNKRNISPPRSCSQMLVQAANSFMDLC